MIRAAKYNDIPRMVEMGTRFVAEHYPNQLASKPEAMGKLVEQMIASDDALLLVSEDVYVRGMIGIFLFHHPMSGELTASETFWWIDPESRGGGDGVRLMRDAENWARERGAVRMQMIAPDDRVGEFYRRLGYGEVETTWQKEL